MDEKRFSYTADAAKEKLLENYPYIMKIVRFKTDQYDLDYDSTLNFILDKLSADDYKIIRSFRGKSKFTTFLTIVVNNMIFRYAGKNRNLPEMPTIISETPLDFLIRQQQMECKELFLKNLPGLLDELNYKEKVILKMRYFKDIKISRISRILGLTRYETQKKLDSGLNFLRKKIKEICKTS
jgi:RNA polymerase sigma factor (sigma-70 family)